MRFILAGGTGYVGSRLTTYLMAKGHEVITAGRNKPDLLQMGHIHWDLANAEVPPPPLPRADCIINTVGQAHSRSGGPDKYNAANVVFVERLAAAASAAGIPHLIHISSIHAVARRSPAVLTEATPCAPDTLYGQSKLEGELRLKHRCTQDKLIYTIIRPPAIIGPGAKHALTPLMHLIGKGLPLPFAGIPNKRSYIGINSLCSLLLNCALTERSANQTFHVADYPSVSTGELVSYLAALLGKPSRLFRVPSPCWSVLEQIAPIEQRFGAIWESLKVSTEYAETTLDKWKPGLLNQAILDLDVRHN